MVALAASLVVLGCSGTPAGSGSADDTGGDTASSGADGCLGYAAWDMFDDPLETDPYTRGRSWVPPSEECLASCTATASIGGYPWSTFAYDDDGALLTWESGGDEHDVNGAHGWRETYGSADGFLVDILEERDEDLDGVYELTVSVESRIFGAGDGLLESEHRERYYDDGTTYASDTRYLYRGGQSGQPTSRERYFASDGDEESYTGRRDFTWGGDGIETAQYVDEAGELGDLVTWEWLGGRVVTETVAREELTLVYRLEYAEFGGVSAFVSEYDPDDSTTYHYDAAGRLSKIEANDGSAIEYAWSCP